MQNILCYNVVVQEKKDQPFALRVPESLLELVQRIANKEDRPLGYVGRELMIRGIGLYLEDGILKDQNLDLSAGDRPEGERTENAEIIPQGMRVAPRAVRGIPLMNPPKEDRRTSEPKKKPKTKRVA